jgi:septal ring factor EnvC (AmiA/AmiB activator)
LYSKNDNNKPKTLAAENSFHLKALKEKEQIAYTGFIAQDVGKAAKELGFDFSCVDAAKNDNDNYGLRYAAFVVPLVKAVQEQQAMINNQQEQIDELKKDKEDQQQRLDDLEKKLTELLKK